MEREKRERERDTDRDREKRQRDRQICLLPQRNGAERDRKWAEFAS